MSKSPRILDIEKAVHGNKVKTDFIEVPFTTIKDASGNPRKIPNLENNLKASFGVERIGTTHIKRLLNEFGPEGQAVYETHDKDARIRFVGRDWKSNSNTNGGADTYTTSVDDYMEITFYGTGLNMLTFADASAKDNRATVDGGTEGPNYLPQTTGLLSGRLYEKNLVVPVVSGLPLGIHTVKLRLAAISLTYFGCEILNESSQLVINQGQPFIGGKGAELTSQQLLDIKPAELIGTKGGRVVTYLNEDGTIGQAVTPTDPQVTEGSPTELVTNGDFSTGDLTGWTTFLGSPAGSITVNGSNQAVLTLGGSFGTNADLRQELTTVIGQQYTLKFDLISVTGGGTGTALVFEDNTRTTVLQQQSYPTGDSGNKKITFTAVSTTTLIEFSPEVIYGTSMIVDNASVKETAFDFLTMEDTDHSQEEMFRKIHWEEFGRYRSDDFTRMGVDSAATRGYTLDDGTTTLVGNAVYRWSGHPVSNLYTSTTGAFWCLTFVGTGLDLIMVSNGTPETFTFEVDGEVITSSFNFAGETKGKRVKVCSGLPYGVHTVKYIRNNSTNSAISTSEFLIYQPKKPEIPDTAVQEICDYNVMADYDDSKAVGTGYGAQPIRGALWKPVTREFIMGGSGTWQFGSNNAVRETTLTQAFNTAASGQFIEYTFYGNDFTINFDGPGASNPQTMNIEINGVLNDTGVDLSGVITNNGGGSYTQAGADGSEAYLSFRNLGLGKKTVRITKTAGASSIEVIGFYIGTPIHINDNSLKIGSLSLADKREDPEILDESGNKVDLSRAKAWLVYDAVNNNIQSSYNIAAVYEPTSLQDIVIWFKVPFRKPWVATTGDSSSADLRVSGVNEFSGIQQRFAAAQIRATTNVNVWHVVFYGELENEENIDLGDL